MMESRRCPRAMPALGSTQTPSASGPRWRRLSTMERAVAPRVSSDKPLRASSNPAMPHMPGVSSRWASHGEVTMGAFHQRRLTVRANPPANPMPVSPNRVPWDCELSTRTLDAFAGWNAPFTEAEGNSSGFDVYRHIYRRGGNQCRDRHAHRSQ